MPLLAAGSDCKLQLASCMRQVSVLLLLLLLLLLLSQHDLSFPVLVALTSHIVIHKFWSSLASVFFFYSNGCRHLDGIDSRRRSSSSHLLLFAAFCLPGGLFDANTVFLLLQQ
jgi:hypothetical protein